nr:hypothetical protein CFP56_56334 [Quercus suber]
MEKKALDYILVPLGLLAMVAYHLLLLYRIMNYPNKTVIGINTVHRRFWVRAMMEDESKNGILAIQTLRNNLMASIRLASIATMLSSVIAVLMRSGNQDKSALLVFGDRSELDFSIKFKFSSILVCFLVTLLFSVQSVRKNFAAEEFVFCILPWTRARTLRVKGHSHRFSFSLPLLRQILSGGDLWHFYSGDLRRFYGGVGATGFSLSSYRRHCSLLDSCRLKELRLQRWRVRNNESIATRRTESTRTEIESSRLGRRTSTLGTWMSLLMLSSLTMVL